MTSTDIWYNITARGIFLRSLFYKDKIKIKVSEKCWTFWHMQLEDTLYIESILYLQLILLKI